MVKDRKRDGSRVGAASELAAAVWLLKAGYEVFRNVSPIGKADLVAVRGGEIIRIDVKTAAITSSGKVGLHAAKNEHLGIEYLYVFPDGSCMWKREIIDRDMHSRPRP